MAEDIVVELKNVRLDSDRGPRVFTDLSLELRSGRSAVITGEAGSGKTCFVEMVTGRRFVDSGLVRVFGRIVKPRDGRSLRWIRRRIGGVGGVYGLIPSFTVAENVAYPLVLTGETRRVRKERVLRELSEFSLVNLAGEYPARLTRVEYTLAQFARASVANQPLLIIDEPSAGLDTRTHERIFEYLIKVAASGRSMIILTSEIMLGDVPNADNYQITNGILA